MKAPGLIRRDAPFALILLVALFIMINYYFGAGRTQGDYALKYVGVIASMAVPIGLINAVRNHLRFLRQKTKGQWQYSILFLGGVFLTLLIGLIPPIGANSTVRWVYTVTFVNISIAITAVTGAFFATAIFRALRIRTGPSVVLIISTVIVILGSVPIGSIIWEQIPPLREWILNIPTAGVYRGIMIGMGMGVIGYVVRLFTGRERPW